MANKPFDLSRIDFKKNRDSKRRYLLLRTAAPAMILLILAILYMTPNILTAIAIRDYKYNNSSFSRLLLGPVSWTFAGRFVTEYNKGTVDTKLGKYPRSQIELSKALSIAPPKLRCKTAQNLFSSYDAYANSLKDKTQATNYTDLSAKLATKYPKCFEENKRKIISTGSSNSSSSSSQLPTMAQQKQLVQKQQNAQQMQQDATNGQAYDPSKSSVKPW